MPSRIPKRARRSNNVLLLLNERERDALDRQVEQLGGLEYQTYLRTLILAADRGELPVSPEMFRFEP